MMLFYSIAACSLLMYYCYSQVASFHRNLSAAKASGLPYKIVMGSILSPIFLLPFIDRLPKSWTEGWLPLLVFPKTWHAGYGPFAEVGADTFIAVTSSHNSLWTCDPEAVLQISKSKDDFPKATKSLAVLNVYGPTVTSTDGSESRLYRRITSPAFNDQTLSLVWADTLEQTKLLLGVWEKGADQGFADHVGKDAARMTLHVMSRVCFGQKMDWIDELRGRHEISKGHNMSYGEALSSMLENIKIVFAIPQLCLKLSPFASHKIAWKSFSEWQLYMEEMQASKRAELQARNDTEALVRAGPQEPTSSHVKKPCTTNATAATPLISTAAIFGNMFIFLLAGHETSASTLQFAITCLACHPAHQRRLQRSLDTTLGDRDPSTWSYRTDFPLLLRRFPGAIVAETVRLFTVLPFYLRCTEPGIPRTLNLAGRIHSIPPDTLVLVNTSATHRHPAHWARTAPPEIGEAEPQALSDFDPRRWLAGHGEDPLDEKTLQPKPGTYIPFSVGTRACMGSRFAEIEIVAMLACIFSQWSVELAVPEGEGLESWHRARTRARSCLNEKVGFGMALKMNEEVPVKLVRRGEERWNGD